MDWSFELELTEIQCGYKTAFLATCAMCLYTERRSVLEKGGFLWIYNLAVHSAVKS
jgi:hypothetical protein